MNALATAAIKFNMNDMFRVTLTEFGSEHINKIRKHANEALAATDSKVRYDLTLPDDVLEMSLWTFMQMFGSCMYEGAPDSPFVENKMEFVQHT